MGSERFRRGAADYFDVTRRSRRPLMATAIYALRT